MNLMSPKRLLNQAARSPESLDDGHAEYFPIILG